MGETKQRSYRIERASEFGYFVTSDHARRMSDGYPIEFYCAGTLEKCLRWLSDQFEPARNAELSGIQYTNAANPFL